MGIPTFPTPTPTSVPTTDLDAGTPSPAGGNAKDETAGPAYYVIVFVIGAVLFLALLGVLFFMHSRDKPPKRAATEIQLQSSMQVINEASDQDALNETPV